MRIINVMTFVCFLLILALIPAGLQLANLCGLHPSVTLSTATVLMLCAGFLHSRT